MRPWPSLAPITTGYAYDTGSNRSVKLVSTDGTLTTKTLYTYNDFNQLTGCSEEDGLGAVTRTADLTYDLAGNRATQTLTVTGQSAQTTTYHWDAENRLEGVTLPNADEHEYGYDYRTRRISRVENGIGTAIVFSGGLSVAEYESQGITPTVEYLRGPDMGGGVGGMMYSLRNGGTEAKYAMSNGRGDVVAQSNDAGALTWTASYEAYGKRPVETGTNLDRQRANTKEEDPTGLLNEGFRYRDIETGVWLSRDPAGFVDGPNLYAYVRQNPWTSFDPDELDSRPFHSPIGGSSDWEGRRVDVGVAWQNGGQPEKAASYGLKVFGWVAGYGPGPGTAGRFIVEHPNTGQPTDSMPNQDAAMLVALQEGARMQALNPVSPLSVPTGNRPTSPTKTHVSDLDLGVKPVDPKTSTAERIKAGLPAGQRRTPAENKQARNYFKNNKQKARDAYTERTGQEWPVDDTGNPWPAEHTRSLKEGGDPMSVEPRNPATDPHNVPGADGLTDYQRWGAEGTPAREARKKEGQ